MSQRARRSIERVSGQALLQVGISGTVRSAGWLPRMRRSVSAGSASDAVAATVGAEAGIGRVDAVDEVFFWVGERNVSGLTAMIGIGSFWPVRCKSLALSGP